MQIHELNTFQGLPGSGDYLAIDDGTETSKIEADKLGVATQMTIAEAKAGTVTEPRVITPKVLHDYVVSFDNMGVLEITQTSISSLPLTISNSRLTPKHVISRMVLSNPSAQTGDWTFNTDTAGQVTISGNISGTTDATFYFDMKVN